MKFSIKEYLLIAKLLLIQSVMGQSLQGYIYDLNSRESLPGAVIYIPDLKTGTITNQEGKYYLSKLPKGKFLVQVKMLGYASVSVLIDLNYISTQDFFLQMTAIEKKEVIVTGSPFTTDPKISSVPVTPVEKMKIITSPGDNLSTALSQIPGVAAISTGSGIAKPVIRGLSFNRVLVINNGVRQEGQQWGDEHGLEIDKFSVDRIEILKGPSSLLYGSDALGGVINVLEPIPAPDGSVRGEVISQYSSNNRNASGSVMAEGSHSGFIWRTRHSLKNAISYKTPAERVYNSGFREYYSDAMIGMHKSWGFSHLHFSRWKSKAGIPEGERDTVSSRLLNHEGLPATESELLSRDIFTPFQDIKHRKLSSVSNFILGKNQLRVNAGIQENIREEYESEESEAELGMNLRTATADVRLHFPERNSISTAIGISGMIQENKNSGEELLIPDYDLQDAGVYFNIKKSYSKTSINAGLRYDTRTMESAAHVEDSAAIFLKQTFNFGNFSAAAGLSYSLSEKLSMRLNLSRGYRAPNISELTANGIHEGLYRFETGNPTLKAETSVQADIGFSYDSEHISIAADLFANRINNFIYARNEGNEVIIIDGEELPRFQYVQGTVEMKGFEFTLDFHPHEDIHFENTLSFVDGRNTDIGMSLPYIPPLTIVNELRYDIHTDKKKKISDPYVKLGVHSRLKQKKIDQFETITPGAAVINLSAGANIKLSNQEMNMFISVNNLLDKAYYDHLSRLKAAGIMEQGINITAGISLPFGIKNPK
ncbi:MAG: TonB-dependent receptor [Bacteroidetes bacterium]|nr:MAG: TonB-dependent receptor [Bacteroidota bacterium]REK06641.1 MAG: TonB-dependent receptor [Bacteroidota bacterium]REK49805.1 MAG: TonB-dependent receptor [Bacteroidota bacterium]